MALKMSGTSVVEMVTAPPDRTQSGSKSTDGRIWCRRMYPKSVETQMASRNLSNSLQGGYVVLRIVGNGGSPRNLEKNPTATWLL